MRFRTLEGASSLLRNRLSFKHPCARNWLWAVLVLSCVMVPAGASAASMSESFANLYEGVGAFSEKIFPGRKTLITVGLGPKYSPDYLGSDDYDLDLDFAFFLKLKRFEASNSGLSFDFLRERNVALGPLIKFTSGRKERANEALTGLGNISKAIHLGGFVQYTLNNYSFRLAVLKNITSWNQGWHGFFRISSLLLNRGPWALVGSFKATWGNNDYSATWFGIDDEQSGNSGIPTYDAGSGMRDVALELSSLYALSEKWSINASIRYRHLLSGAADSPLVADYGSPHQLTASIYGAYTF
jgi:outer membrane protein